MNKSTGNTKRKFDRLSARCRTYQRLLQSHADKAFGQHKPFVGLPLPIEGREWIGMIELPNQVAAEFHWLDNEPIALIRQRMEMAMLDCLEFQQ